MDEMFGFRTRIVRISKRGLTPLRAAFSLNEAVSAREQGSDPESRPIRGGGASARRRR